MEKKEFLEMYDILINHYYKILNEKGCNISKEELFTSTNVIIINLIGEYIKLHQAILNYPIDDSLFINIGEISDGNKNYQVQICAIKDKKLWIEEYDRIQVRKLFDEYLK